MSGETIKVKLTHGARPVRVRVPRDIVVVSDDGSVAVIKAGTECDAVVADGPFVIGKQ